MTDHQDQQQTETWQVHVLGPDDILPATDRIDAMSQAQQINAASITSIVMSNDDPMMPLAWAVPQQVRAQKPSCTCGSPDAFSLNPAEVLVHRVDAPCYIAEASR